MAYYSEHGLALTLLRKLRWMRHKLFNGLLSFQKGIPAGTKLDPSAQIRGLRHITIGRGFSAGLDFKLEALRSYGDQRFEPRVTIGDNVVIHDFVHIGAIHHVEIGNNVLMASKIYISDHNHGFYAGAEQSDPEEPPEQRTLDGTREVIIGDNVWIGEFVSVLPGARIGRGSIIGANSVVTGEIPPHSIAVGTPARVIKRWDPELRQWVPVPR